MRLLPTKKYVRDTIQLQILGMLLIQREGLNREEAPDSDRASIADFYLDIRGLVDEVPLGGHAAFRPVNRVVQVVAGQHNRKINPVGHGKPGRKIELPLPCPQTNGLRKSGVRGKSFDLDLGRGAGG